MGLRRRPFSGAAGLALWYSALLSLWARRTASAGPGTVCWSPIRAGSVGPVHLSQDPRKKVAGVEGRGLARPMQGAGSGL